MKIGRVLLVGSCVVALCIGGAAEAKVKKPLKCANPAEITAMQAAAIQQELMDAALTCGDEARDNYNAFQTSFGPELRRSDKTLLQLFRRVHGYSKGDAAYNLFKTEMASKAELRRVHGNQDFCTAANLVVAAALGPDKPRLEDFVGGVAVTEKPQGPIDSCELQVAVTLRGAMAAPMVVPKPNPLRVAALVPPEPPAPQPVVPQPAPGNSAVVAPAPEQVPVPPQEPPKDEPKKPEKPSGWFSGLWN